MTRRLASLCVCVSLTWTVGCDTQAPPKSVAPVAAQGPTLEEQTQSLLDDCTALRIRIRQVGNGALDLSFRTRNIGQTEESERWTALSTSCDSSIEAIDAIVEEIRSHSDYKLPRIDEIRHKEVDHAALRARLSAIAKKSDAAFEQSRERR